LEQAEKCREPEEETREVRRFIVPLKSGNADSNRKAMSPELVRISQLCEENPEMVFSQLMHHFDEDSLSRCYSVLSGKAAVGSDGISKAHYGVELESNLSDLVERLKRMGYRPSPVKEVLIPKEFRSC